MTDLQIIGDTIQFLSIGVLLWIIYGKLERIEKQLKDRK